jgi:hypothetical protein
MSKNGADNGLLHRHTDLGDARRKSSHRLPCRQCRLNADLFQSEGKENKPEGILDIRDRQYPVLAGVSSASSRSLVGRNQPYVSFPSSGLGMPTLKLCLVLINMLGLFCSCHTKRSLAIGIPKLEFGNEMA